MFYLIPQFSNLKFNEKQPNPFSEIKTMLVRKYVGMKLATNFKISLSLFDIMCML